MKHNEVRTEVDQNGMTRYVISFSYRMNGSPIRIREQSSHFDGLKHAQDRVDEIKAQCRAGTYVKPHDRVRLKREEEQQREEQQRFADKQLFKSFCLDFYEFHINGKRKELKESSKRNFDVVIRSRLLPFFGKMKLTDINEKVLEDWVEWCVNKDWKSSTIGTTFDVLLVILKKAVKRKLIDRMPNYNRSELLPKVEQIDRAILNREQIVNLVNVCPDEVYKGMLICAVTTGMRQSEIRALRWSDVDFQRKHICVRVNLSLNTLTTPKSNKSRYVPLSEDFAHWLKSRPKSSLYVFTNEDGNLITIDATNKKIKKIFQKAGFGDVPGIGWHTLRRTYATLLNDAGVSLIDIQRSLGHSSVTTTQRYIQSSKPVSDSSYSVVNSIFAARQNCQFSVNSATKNP